MTSRPRVVGALHDLRPDAVRADHDGRAVVDVVEAVDGLDARRLQVADDALVVDDLAERMGRLARRRRFLGLVDGLADAVAEPVRRAIRISSTVPITKAVSHLPSCPGRSRGAVVRLDAPCRRRRRDGAAGAGPAIRPMISSVAGGLGVASRQPLRHVVKAERRPDAQATQPPIRWPSATRPERSVFAMPTGRIVRAGPKREDRRPSFASCSPPPWTPRSFRKDHQRRDPRRGRASQRGTPRGRRRPGRSDGRR